VSLYDDTLVTLRGLAEAATAEDALFCERRPLTSLEAGFAKADELASRLRVTEDAALEALRSLVDAEQGYEVALEAIDAAGPEVRAWLRAVTLARALEAPTTPHVASAPSD
jgi:hypothetical protein